MRSILLLLSTGLLTAAHAAPPSDSDALAGVVSGVVRDENGNPVVGAQVSGSHSMTTTGRDGAYTLRGLPPGTVTVKVRARGYRPAEERVEVREGETTTHNFTLNAGASLARASAGG